MLTPDLRAVQNEMMRAISKKPQTELKPGAPPRNPNIREVVQGLVDLGDFQAAKS